jgi:hypothetical protein
MICNNSKPTIQETNEGSASSNKRCSLWEPHETQMHSVYGMQSCDVLKKVVPTITTGLVEL